VSVVASSFVEVSLPPVKMQHNSETGLILIKLKKVCTDIFYGTFYFPISRQHRGTTSGIIQLLFAVEVSRFLEIELLPVCS
jgi:hypothetical protein